MALSLHSDIRRLSGKNTNRCIRPPEAAAFLLAKAVKGDANEVMPADHAISNKPESRYQEGIRSDNFQQNHFSFQCFLLKV
jgi:hypothetical protein